MDIRGHACLLLLLASVGARPKSSLGHCSSNHNEGDAVSRSLMRTCLKDFLPPESDLAAMKTCNARVTETVKHDPNFMREIMKAMKKVKKTSFKNLDGHLIMSMKENVMQLFGDCMVTTLNLNTTTGVLNVTKIFQMIERIQQDAQSLGFARSAARTCAELMPMSNVTQQFLNVSLCLKMSVREFCNNQSTKISKLLTTESNSTCSPVTVSQKVKDVVAECMSAPSLAAEDTVIYFPENIFGNKRNRFGRGVAMEVAPQKEAISGRKRNHQSSEEDDDDHMSRESRMDKLKVDQCMGEKTGIFLKSKGINYTALNQLVATFPGWETIPQVLTSLQAAITNCSVEFGGDELKQCVAFSRCLFPQYTQFCGLKSELTMFLFHGMLPREIEKMLEKRVNPEDEDDVEVVDSGLINEAMAMILTEGQDDDLMSLSTMRERRNHGGKADHQRHDHDGDFPSSPPTVADIEEDWGITEKAEEVTDSPIAVTSKSTITNTTTTTTTTTTTSPSTTTTPPSTTTTPPFTTTTLPSTTTTSL